MSKKLTREIVFMPAYDQRPKNKGDKDYGIHGVDMRWYLHGPKGVIQFVVYTGWYIPTLVRELGHHGEPLPADVGYHSYVPMYEGQEPITPGCEILGGSKCYYDGSGLRAYEYFDTLTKEGGEAVWKLMEEEYERRFNS